MGREGPLAAVHLGDAAVLISIAELLGVAAEDILRDSRTLPVAGR